MVCNVCFKSKYIASNMLDQFHFGGVKANSQNVNINSTSTVLATLYLYSATHIN